MYLLLLLIPGLPLAAAVITLICGPRLLRERSHLPVMIGTIAAFVCSLLLVWRLPAVDHEQAQPGAEVTYTYWNWITIPTAWHVGGTLGSSDSPYPTRDFRIDITLRADALSAIMVSMVTFISSLVVFFSAGYMHGERGYWRFFALVGLFVFSMNMLVLSSNFLLLFVFWEAVGVCSYLLIGFWYEKDSASAAGKKAFLVNRIGDVGLILAMFLMWIHYGTLNFHDSPAGPGILGTLRLTGEIAYLGAGPGFAICLLLLLGACGKSAQLPLMVWLPDAMEGPTPVSALIHAATMVTAGVYLIARATPLFDAAPEAQLVVAIVGGATALLSALIALTQTDLKRVLAYSTVSQLGFMFLALGTGTIAGVVAGMFHLFTHAFFKALLFLGSGSVMHAMGNVIDMRRFGGLRKLLPVTHATFAFGCLALAGVPPFAGFWSKDAILVAVHERATPTNAHPPSLPDGVLNPLTAGLGISDPSLNFPDYTSVYRGLFYLAALTALLTAFYTFRAFFLTFYGELRVPPEAGNHAHESPAQMTIPLLVLAVCSVAVGLVGHWNDAFASLLEQTPSLAYGLSAESAHAGHSHRGIVFLSIALSAVGIGSAAFFYLKSLDEVGIATRWMNLDWLEQIVDMKWLYGWSHRLRLPALARQADGVGLGWFVRLLGYLVLLVIGLFMAPLLLGYYVSPYKLSLHKFFLDEIYSALIVRPLRAVADLLAYLDRVVIDNLVHSVAALPLAAGALLRRLQTGLLPYYGLAMAIGAIGLIAASALLLRG